MRRIFLLGNGFDLAHGLETRYGDFINWYKNWFVKHAFHKIGWNGDELIEIDGFNYINRPVGVENEFE